MLFIVVLGSLNLVFPFVSDQVVALIGAKTIAAGGVLYVDFWDNKLPGLIWFHYVAGQLFGYNEFGVHLLEMLWMGTFSLVLMLALRSYVSYPWLSALVPIAVVGTYYATAEPFLLTQLEGLVGFPIFLAAWLATRFPESERLRRAVYFASGICAGITVVFKLVFAPLFVVFWAIVSMHNWRLKGSRVRELILDLWVPVSAGVLLILGFTALKFWNDGSLDELVWTAFEYPPLALEQSIPAPYYRLADSLRYFLTSYFPWIAFVGVVVVQWWRGSADLLTSLLIAWLIVGSVLILIQRFSWWPYHFLSLFAPVGILGVKGFAIFVKYLAEYIAAKALSARLLSLFLLIPLLGVVVMAGGQKASAYVTVLVEKKGDVRDFQRGLNSDYALAHRSTRFLVDSAATEGDIYVFGDPIYYFMSGRDSALPIIGWPWEFFLDSQWNALPDQLNAEKPPYIYIDKVNAVLMARRGGGVKEFIEQHYLELVDDRNGSWYILRPKYR